MSSERASRTDAERAKGARSGLGQIPRPLVTISGYAWRFLVVVLAALVIVYVVMKLRLVFMPVAVALFLATLLSPLVGRLRRRGLRPGLATAIVFVGAILAVAGLISLLAPQVGSEASEMSRSVKQGADQALRYLTTGPLNLSDEQVQSFVDSASEQLQRNRDKITSGVIAGAVKIGEFLTALILTLFLLFFFLKDGAVMWAWFVGQFDAGTRVHLRNLGDRVWSTMGAYLRGIAIVGSIEGTAIGIVLAILGVPLLIPLVLLQFFAAFFPVVGALVAGIVATLVALVAGGPSDALIVGIAIIVIQQADNHLLQPLVMGRAVKLHPVVVILVLAAGGVIGGILGALIAVPLAAIVSTIGNYINGLRDRDPPTLGRLQEET